MPVHRRYTSANRSRTDAVLAAYDDAIGVSRAATEALDQLAISLSTPSAVLTEVPRKAITPSYSPQRKTGQPWLADHPAVTSAIPPGSRGSPVPAYAATIQQLTTDLLTDATAVTAQRRRTIS